MENHKLEALVRQVVEEVLGAGGVKKITVPAISVTEGDRLNTGNPKDQVYTHDLFTPKESPRLGAGVMEITDSRFPWRLDYDEMDYVLEGRLTIHSGGISQSAGPGELIYIPKGSSIEFDSTGHCRFLYFVYPAEWQ